MTSKVTVEKTTGVTVYGIAEPRIINEKTNKTTYAWWTGKAPEGVGGVFSISPFSGQDTAELHPTKSALTAAWKAVHNRGIPKNLIVVAIVDGEPKFPVPAVPENTPAQQFDHSIKKAVESAVGMVKNFHNQLERIAKLVDEAKSAGSDHFKELGFASWPAYIADRLAPVAKQNASIVDRRAVVAMLTEAGMSTRVIGDVVGTSHVQVGKDQKAIEAEKETGGNPVTTSGVIDAEVVEPPVKVTGRDGKTYTKPKPKPKPVSWIVEATKSKAEPAPLSDSLLAERPWLASVPDLKPEPSNAEKQKQRRLAKIDQARNHITELSKLIRELMAEVNGGDVTKADLLPNDKKLIVDLLFTLSTEARMTFADVNTAAQQYGIAKGNLR